MPKGSPARPRRHLRCGAARYLRGAHFIPRLGCLNVRRFSTRWREGEAPIERAILAGDTGRACASCAWRRPRHRRLLRDRSIPIEGKSSAELTDDLALLGARALITALEHLEQGAVRWTAQAEGVTYAEKIAKGELDVDPEASLFDNVRRVRASSVAHPSRCVIADRAVTVLEAAPFHDGDVEKGCGVFGQETAHRLRRRRGRGDLSEARREKGRCFGFRGGVSRASKLGREVGAQKWVEEPTGEASRRGSPDLRAGGTAGRAARRGFPRPRRRLAGSHELARARGVRSGGDGALC